MTRKQSEILITLV